MVKINPKILSMLGQGGSIFSVALMDIIQSRPEIRVLSADMSTPAGLDKFKSAYPDKFINVGIAEQNMIGIAAGLSDEGYRTICVAQSCFLTMRSFEQIRQYAGYMRIPLILVGIGSGYTLSYFGNTHYAIEDMAVMRSIPGMQVLAPADSLEAMEAMYAAVNSNAPTYIRLFGGTGIPVVYADAPIFRIGKAVELRKGNDVQLIAIGSMVSMALAVADNLEAEGLSTSVIDMHTVKPLDVPALDMNVKVMVTLEEHNIIGGLGSAVSEALAERNIHPKVIRMGTNDCFSHVGDYPWILADNKMDASHIVEKILHNIN